MDSPYCEICGCCGEIPCCYVEKFLEHGKGCKYYEVYKKEILDNLDVLCEARRIIINWNGYNTQEEPTSSTCNKNTLIQLSRLLG